MPTFDFTTNVKIADEKTFILEFSEFGAKTLGKPEKYISINFKHNPNLTFGGTFDPAFSLTIASLDNINPEANEKYSKAFFGFFKEKLGVAGDRGYINFNDPGFIVIQRLNANLVWRRHEGTTFATIFGK